MKKEDSSKTPEALTAQKELNAYVQRKIQIMELETNSIVDQGNSNRRNRDLYKRRYPQCHRSC